MKNKLTIDGAEYLRDEHGLDFLQGETRIDLNNYNQVAGIYIALHFHDEPRLTIAEVRKDMDFMEVLAEVSALFEGPGFTTKAEEPGKKPARKRRKTGG